MEIVRSVFGAHMLVLLLWMPMLAAAQSRGTSQPPDASTRGIPGPSYPSRSPMSQLDLGQDSDDSAQMQTRRENIRKVQRKERMVSSANRLLELTKRFQTDLASHPDLTPENAKQLDEISRLAREVKSRMQE